MADDWSIPFAIDLAAAYTGSGLGQRVFARSSGSGPTVLLLHGWNHSSAVWTAVAQELSRAHHVVAPDWPGFGASPPTRPDGSLLADYVRVLTALLARLESPARPAVICADSMAAIVTLRLLEAGKLPDCGVVLSGCPYSGLGPAASIAAAFKLVLVGQRLARALPKKLAAALVRPTFILTVRERRHVGDSLVESLLAAHPETAQRTLSELKGPHHLHAAVQCIGRNIVAVRGEFDALAPRDVTERLCRDLQAELVEIPGAAHSPMVEAPEAFARIVARAVAREDEQQCDTTPPRPLGDRDQCLEPA